jgi:hypothetical protein
MDQIIKIEVAKTREQASEVADSCSVRMLNLSYSV